jgi:hypothetical protein
MGDLRPHHSYEVQHVAHLSTLEQLKVWPCVGSWPLRPSVNPAAEGSRRVGAAGSVRGPWAGEGGGGARLSPPEHVYLYLDLWILGGFPGQGRAWQHLGQQTPLLPPPDPPRQLAAGLQADPLLQHRVTHYTALHYTGSHTSSLTSPGALSS